MLLKYGNAVKIMGMTLLWLLVLPILASILISCGVAAYAWHHRKEPGSAAYAWLAANQAAWTLFLLFEILSSTLAGKVFWDDIQWINTVLSPLLLLVFAIQYTGVNILRKRWSWWALAAFPALFLVAVFSDPWTGLIRPDAALVPGELTVSLVYSFTPLVWLLSIYSYALVIAAAYLLVRKYLRSTWPYRQQVAVVLVGSLVPIFGTFLTLGGVTILGQRDLTPLTFAIGNLVVAFGLSRYRLFDIVPVAQDLIVENLQDPVVVVDPKDRVVYMNRTAYTSMAMPAAELIGRPVEDVYSRWSDLVEHFASLHSGASEIIQLSVEDHLFYYEIRVSPLTDGRGRYNGRAVIAHDVTRLKTAEAELRRSRENLEKLVEQRTTELSLALEALQINAEQLEQRVFERTAELEKKNRELETFAYSVSHDLKAPLRGIDGYSRLLEDYSDRLDVEGQLFLRNIRKGAAQMSQLIEDLLVYSRMQRRAVNRDYLELDAIVNQVLDERSEEIQQRGVEVIVDLQCSEVSAEMEGLVQAMRNLVDNALKFSAVDRLLRIEIRSWPAGDISVISVSDNGIGFDMQYNERIFEPFQRLQRVEDYPGTGIGLALVQMAMERLGGRVRAESMPGFGATFYLEIPNRDGQQANL
jgi:PAS domain S-box-containing protein